MYPSEGNSESRGDRVGGEDGRGRIRSGDEDGELVVERRGRRERVWVVARRRVLQRQW